MSERNQPFLQPNELCIKQFSPEHVDDGAFNGSLEKNQDWTLGRQIAASNSYRFSECLRGRRCFHSRDVHGIQGTQPGIPDAAAIYLDFPELLQGFFHATRSFEHRELVACKSNREKGANPPDTHSCRAVVTA